MPPSSPPAPTGPPTPTPTPVPPFSINEGLPVSSREEDFLVSSTSQFLEPSPLNTLHAPQLTISASTLVHTSERNVESLVAESLPSLLKAQSGSFTKSAKNYSDANGSGSGRSAASVRGPRESEGPPDSSSGGAERGAPAGALAKVWRRKIRVGQQASGKGVYRDVSPLRRTRARASGAGAKKRP